MVFDQIPYYLQIYHEKIDLYTRETKVMANPNYILNNFDGLILQFQLNFTDPNQLSLNNLRTKDYIVVVVNNTQFLLSLQNELATAKKWRVTTKLPVQLNQTTKLKLENKIAFIVAIQFTTVFSSDFVVNLLLAKSLQKSWGILNVLQPLLQIPLLNVILPNNTMILFSALLDIATFNMLPSDEMTNAILGEDKFSSFMLDPYNDRLDIMKYST